MQPQRYVWALGPKQVITLKSLEQQVQSRAHTRLMPTTTSLSTTTMNLHYTYDVTLLVDHTSHIDLCIATS